MNYLRVVAALILSALILPVYLANAAASSDESALLQIRAGEHSGFMRIVFEGDETVVSAGKASLQGKDIIVSFTDRNFDIRKSDLPVPFKIDKDVATFSLKQAGRLKAYSLTNPGRFVIDVYPEVEEVKKEAKREAKPAVEKVEKVRASAAVEAPAKDHTDPKERNAVAMPGNDYDEKIFIPEKYKATWSRLESGNFYAVLKEMPGHKPDVQSLAAYHYIYAKANLMAKQYFEVIKHLRLTYIYAADKAFKEQALFKRAGLHMDLKLIYEARADYLVFIRDFPSSRYIEKARFGLAESLSRIGDLQEAIEHYEQAGTRPEVLYGMANALQKMERVEEAKKTYDKAMLMDRTYLKSSPETYYLIGENMRMSGDTEDAKKQFALIESGPFKDKAGISLGLIAMEEPNTQEAIKQFKSAAQSAEQKIKVQAMFNLSLAYIKEGNFKDATASLEYIRHNHIDSNMYKDTLLALSRLYKKGGRMKESVSLLKELVYGKQPPADAFVALEELVLEAGGKSAQDGSFVKLWNEVGQWLIDETREEFLLKVADRLRNEGKPFRDLCSWLVENASQHAKGRAALALADYYIGIGDMDTSRDYVTIAREAREGGDMALRIEAKIHHAEGDQANALNKVMMIREIEKGDLDLLGNIISGMDDPGSKSEQKAIALYEKILNGHDWDPEQYINLADILYENNEKGKALKYYRIANEKSPDNEWAMYRVAQDTGTPEAGEMLSRLQKGDNLLGRLAKSKLMEKALIGRVKEVY